MEKGEKVVRELAGVRNFNPSFQREFRGCGRVKGAVESSCGEVNKDRRLARLGSFVSEPPNAAEARANRVA